MADSWGTLSLGSCLSGASSAVAPDLLPEQTLAWGKNIDIRGGKVSTRPSWVWRARLPDGMVQGYNYFSAMGGMLVMSIAGRLHKVRINASVVRTEEVPLGFINSPVERRAWMCQTVETLVIQNGLDAPIFYDGVTATRSSMRGEVPRGRQMAYGNGRLWVAINAHELVAGDIRMKNKGSELKFTETDYLYGGGTLSFPRGIEALAFIPATGLADYGALLVFGNDYTEAVRADVTSRDQWQSIPGFVTTVLRDAGAASARAVITVNQDLFWRDSTGGVRSLSSGLGNTPIGAEVRRITDHDGLELLMDSSMVFFDNRVLMTASPYITTEDGNTAFRDVVALDFAPLSSMHGKAPAAWCGEWEGVNVIGLVAGKFGRCDRCFAIARRPDGGNELWEFCGTGGPRGDLVEGSEGQLWENRIMSYIETPRRDFGEPRKRKRLERVDLMVSGIDGALDFNAWWRADNSARWLALDGASTCAVTSDASTAAPHKWKNLQPQERAQWRSFTVPDLVNDQVRRAGHIGFSFQLRLAWQGRCRIEKLLLRAAVLSEGDYADREDWVESCVEYEVSGNELNYNISGGGL